MTRWRAPVRYFYDFEFLEDGRTIDPISVGIVCEDGREYYGVNLDANWLEISQHRWLMENVVPHLPTLPEEQWHITRAYAEILDESSPYVHTKRQIISDVQKFLLGDDRPPKGEERELWAWYSAYDHVALSQLWGRMIDLPEGLPMFTRDIKSEHARLGYPEIPESIAVPHNALEDARYNMVLLDYLETFEARQIAETSQRVFCCPVDEDTARELLLSMRSLRYDTWETQSKTDV